MTREAAVAAAYEQVDSGAFFETLARRIAVPTASSEATADVMHEYFDAQITPDLEALGYTVEVYANPAPDGFPFLIATRVEDESLPTVLTYGHADVVRGQDDRWAEGRSPWELRDEGDRWYGRGTADNKAQHSINISALGIVLATRGRLGFNSTILLETGEEIGSPGLREFCEQHTAELQARRPDRLRRSAPAPRPSAGDGRHARRGSTSISRSTCVPVGITRATGVACCATRVRCWRTRSRRSSTATVRSGCRSGDPTR